MLKKTKPITNSLRTMKLIDYKSVLSGDKPLKSLLRPLVKSGGRNNQGKVTAGHRGGGAKRQYRIVDFKRNLDGVSGKIKSIEYDPNRSSFLSLVHYQNGVKKYILAINNLSIGSMIISGVKTTLEIGNALELRHIQTGTIIHNVELKPGKGAQIVRSAGAYAEVLSHDARYTILKLPSGETRKILGTCRATVGRISNEEHNLINFGQAGKSRWRGIRPSVRGAAMNSVDHPHGGGEGKAPRGKHPRTPTGKPALGVKTRRTRKNSTKFIVGTRHALKRGKR